MTDAYQPVGNPRTISAGFKTQVEEADTVAKLVLPAAIADLIHREFHSLARCEWLGQVVALRALIDAVFELQKTLKDIP